MTTRDRRTVQQDRSDQAAREAEADMVEAAYHTALARLGAQALADALALWRDVPTVPARAGSGGVWLATAVRYIALRRRVARALAIACYRLVRALRTGSTITIATPGQQATGGTTLGALHREFARLSGVTVPISLDPATPIVLEPIDNFGGELARLERDAQQEAEIVLNALGPRNLTTKLRQLPRPDTESSPSELVDAQRAEAHRQAGRRQAAAVERLVRNGARSTTWSLANNDQRVLGYVRYSTTGAPCGWCAMLISRGPVYKTADTATSGRYAEGDLYHDNCRCDAKPVYSRQQYDNSTLFELNRTYGELWPTVTRGLSGKAAVSAWRRFIRQQTHQQRNQAPSTAAREAAA